MPIILKLYRCFCHGLKMCMWFGYNPQINFCYFFFRILNLVIFQARILSKGIDCGYLVCATPLTVGLKMCMWFGYYPQINFCHFFRILNLVIFEVQILSKRLDSGYLVYATSHADRRSFRNITGVFVMVWRCACGLDIIFRLTFVTFFRILNLYIFQARIVSKCMYIGYLVCAPPPIVLCQSFWNFTGVFVMVWRCVCGLDIILKLIFVTFSTFWT